MEREKGDGDEGLGLECSASKSTARGGGVVLRRQRGGSRRRRSGFKRAKARIFGSDPASRGFVASIGLKGVAVVGDDGGDDVVMRPRGASVMEAVGGGGRGEPRVEQRVIGMMLSSAWRSSSLASIGWPRVQRVELGYVARRDGTELGFGFGDDGGVAADADVV